MAVVALEYIEVDDRGIAKLIGSRIKVRNLVMAQKANGYSAEQLCEQYPHLEPSQVYAALAYYHANRSEVDKQIEESIAFADRMRAAQPNRHTRAEMERILAERKAQQEDAPKV